MKTRTTRRHPFVDDPDMRDPRTQQQFCLCGLPAENAIHELQRRSDEEVEYEARRVGEADG